MRMKTKNDETKNQAYDNLDNYERSADNDNMRYKNSRNVIKLKEHRNFMVELKLIIRHYKNNNETTENVTTDKVMISSTLIDALKFLLRNTSISSLDSDYGRLFLFPDGKKVRELPYDQNRYKPLTEFYKHGSGCTLLLEFD
ncbi:unnamed protein product [Acanthocheilonema viteae]|uniref:Uncharacterized protein n=1 Tax=Acanthocheilonema viteae TaxID=6277 RepID=A0A498SZ02_ACAVI|nr:unnamed protein product [Acanthocheilonema viteae]